MLKCYVSPIFAVCFAAGLIGCGQESDPQKNASAAWDQRAHKASREARKAWEQASAITTGPDASIIPALSALHSVKDGLTLSTDPESRQVADAALERTLDRSGDLVGGLKPDAGLMAGALRKVATALTARPLAAEAVRQLADASQQVGKSIDERAGHARSAVAELAGKTTETIDELGRSASQAAPRLSELGSNLSGQLRQADDLINDSERKINDGLKKAGIDPTNGLRSTKDFADKVGSDFSKLPKSVRDDLNKIKDQAVDAVVKELDSVGTELQEYVKNGQMDKAIDGAIAAANTASRLAQDISRWGSMSDLQKVQSVMKNLAGIMAAAQPFVSPAVAAYKLPIMAALMILADLIDLGGSGGDGHDAKDGKKDQGDESKKADTQDKPAKPGQGGAGGAEPKDENSTTETDAKQEEAAAGAVDQAMDDSKNAGTTTDPQKLADQIARKANLTDEQARQLSAKVDEAVKKHTGTDRSIDEKDLRNELVGITLDLIRDASAKHVRSEDEAGTANRPSK